MEILDIVDRYGNPTGETVSREEAHKKGLRHRTTHTWVVRYKDDKLQVLLQKRSNDKDTHPGCYDISSAGHIPAGCGYVESGMRELWEELGFESKEEDFIFCAIRDKEGVRENVFHGETFLDNQVSAVYIVKRDTDAENINFQKEEIESVMWMDIDECIEMVDKNTTPNCIVMEELFMVKEKMNKIESK